MNKLKLMNYDKDMVGSIHTIQIVTYDNIVDPEDSSYKNCINYVQLCENNKKKIILNLNKHHGELDTFDEFISVFFELMKQMHIENYTIIRVDFRLDSFDEEHYRLYSKLNKYIVSLFATSYSVRNAYKTVKLFTEKQISVAVKNRYLEIENYDKNDESMGTDRAKSRLELRAKDLNIKSIFAMQSYLTGLWELRIDKVKASTIDTQEVYNRNLRQVYRTLKDVRPVRFRDLTDFIIQYQDSFFMKSQLMNFIESVQPGINAKRKAENHKQRYGFEYFAKRDINFALEIIKEKVLNYFYNSELSDLY